MEPHPSEPSLETPGASQAELKKRAAGNVLGCLCFIALTSIPFICVGLFTRWTEYQDADAVFTLPLVKIEPEFSACAVATVFAMLFGGALGAGLASLWKRLWPLGLVVFFVVAASPAYFAYQRFVIVCVRNDGTAELRYLWPRPSVRTDLTRISAVDAVETEQLVDDNTGDGHYKCELEVEIGGVRHRSVAANYAGVVVEARDRLQRERLTHILNALEKDGQAGTRQAADLWMSLGDANLALGKNADALADFSKALAILERTDGPENLSASRAVFGMGQSYRAQKNNALAEACYRRTLAIQKKNNLEGIDPEYQDASAALIGLLEETGKDDEILHLPRTPHTLMTEWIRRYGREGARKKMEEMMEERRKLKNP